MIKSAIFSFFLLLSFSLISAEKYQITLLAPPGMETQTEANLKLKPKFTSKNEIIGSVSIKGENADPISYIYTDAQFKIIPNLQHPILINNSGFIVATNKNDMNVQICNQISGEIYSLLDHPDLHNKEHGYIHIAGLTSDNKVFGYSGILGSFIYNINERTITFGIPKFPLYPKAVNSRGQMVYSLVKKPGKGYSHYQKCGIYSQDTDYDEFPLEREFDEANVHVKLINENGDAAGTISKSYVKNLSNNDNRKIGFVAFYQGALKLIRLPGDIQNVSSLNLNGCVTGNFHPTDEANRCLPFFLDKDSNEPIFFSGLDGDRTEALCLNNHSQIVGFSFNEKTNTSKAFLWDSKSGIRDLTYLLAENSGWDSLNSAFNINDEGWIIGEGVYMGNKHFFLLTPLH